VRGNQAKKEDAPFELEKVREEDLYLIPDQDWALKPLSLEGLIRLLQMVDRLFGQADSLPEAMSRITEELLAEFLCLLISRPIEFVRNNWAFQSALAVVVAFWDSPECRYLAAGPREEPVPEKRQEPVAWITVIIERLSWNRGWTVDYILGLPFLAVLKLLANLDERSWDKQTETILSVERGVGRAIANALGKGEGLPELPSYRETKRKMKEVAVIKEKGRRFFDAAMR